MGVCSGVFTFFDYSKRVTEHFNVSLMFDTIVSEIEMEMTKARPFRSQADVFLTRIQMRMGDALRQEPVIPGKILKKYSNNNDGNNDGDDDTTQNVNIWENKESKDTEPPVVTTPPTPAPVVTPPENEAVELEEITTENQ